MTALRTVICDDEVLILDALAMAVEARGVSVVATAVDPDSVLSLVRLYQPDVLVLDAHFPGGSSFEVAGRIRAESPGTSVLILTADADEEVWAAFEHEVVSGVVNKSVDCQALLDGVAALSRGERVVIGWQHAPVRARGSLHSEQTLTGRERDVLEALVGGLTTVAIASRLSISSHTVRTHIQSILRKLEVNSRAKATLVAVERGLVAVR